VRSFLSAIAVLLLIAACSPITPRTEPDNLFWPLPPEQPKIKYIKSIYSEDDIGRAYSIRETLFGKTYIDTLSRPYGVYAIHDRIYVTDILAMRVMVFDLAAKSLHVLGDEGAIQVPAAAVADAQGKTYVADAGQAKIAIYDAKGDYLTAFPLKDIKPVGLAINESLGRLYVLDRVGHRVVALDLSGKTLFEFGKQGIENGQFNMPLGIAIDKTGILYILDTGNFRVQIFDADGKFISKFGEVGDRPGFFSRPKGIAVDSEGHIYVVDAAFSNFQIFDRSGNVLLFVGRLGSEPGQMYLPAGVAIDENDRIYVADQLNKRIEVFQYIKTP